VPTPRSTRPGSQLPLVEAILAQGALNPTYDDLAAVTGLSSRTVANALAALRERDLIQASPPRLGHGWGAVLSIAVGAEACRAGLVDANADVHHGVELTPCPGQATLPPAALLERVRTAANEVLARASVDPEFAHDGEVPLVGVATAWPWPVRRNKRPAGTVLHRDWLDEDRSLLEVVAEAIGCPPEHTHALNDANAHALAVVYDKTRALGRSPDEPNWNIALVLRIGGRIGASTMIVHPHRAARLAFVDSRMLGGARGLAGEIAHLPIDQAVVAELNARGSWIDRLAPMSTEWTCSCGQKGHLEALASGEAWRRRMEESDAMTPALLEGMRHHQLTTEDLKSDPRIIPALEDLGRLIGRSLATPILLLDPASITLTGSFAVRPVIDGITAERDKWRHVFGDALTIDAIPGPDATYLGVRGAALAVLRSQIYRRFAEHLAADPTARIPPFALKPAKPT
jgi:predicted NBD/HSP70 family sugar kinase